MLNQGISYLSILTNRALNAMGARRHGQEGPVAPSGNVVFLCISSYSTMLSRH